MIRFILAWCLLVCSCFEINAQRLAGQECFPKKVETELVYDQARILSPGQWRDLNVKLKNFAASSSNQIVVVIVRDLCGMDKSQFAIELGHEWGVGQGKEDNGIVVLVKPKYDESDKGKAFIAVGRGLEGAIPDVTAYNIVESLMLPEFKANRYYQGIDAAVDDLIARAKGEYNKEVKPLSSFQFGKVIWIIIGVIFLFIGLKVYRVRRYAQLNNISFWLAWSILNERRAGSRGYYDTFSGNGGHGGGWWFGGGGGSSGGFDSGGSSGSDFGGFGGGDFGGGGAGGEW